MTQTEATFGWSGKLPCRGDFIEGGARLDLFGWFADWASEGAARVRAGGGPMADAFLTAPLVRFVAAAGVLGSRAALGVLGPGMDRAGRLYPFLIASEPGEIGAPEPGLQANTRWFDEAEAAFLDFLAPDFDAALIAERLADLPEPQAVPDSAGGAGLAWRSAEAPVETAGTVPEMVRLMNLPAAAPVLDGQAG